MMTQPPPVAPQGDPQPAAGTSYQAPAGYALVKAKRKKWPWVLGGVVALFVIIGIASGGGDDSGPSAPDGPANPAASSGTTYEVTSEGGGTALVTYTSDDSFNISQENGAALPWSKTVDLGSGVFSGGGASLTAQGDESATSITCRVTRDGEMVSENTSTGQFAVVTCSGF